MLHNIEKRNVPSFKVLSPIEKISFVNRKVQLFFFSRRGQKFFRE